MRRLGPLTIALAALCPALLSCRYDPVPQGIIDDLGAEQGTPSADHRPGQPCLVCHGSYGGVAPIMAFGGTIYTTDDEGGILPAPKVPVIVSDSAGTFRKACSSASGNFSLKKEDWKDVAFPLTVVAGTSNMRSLIGRDGSCGSCHKPPDPDAVPARNPTTGAGLDSPGVILVDSGDLDTCEGGT